MFKDRLKELRESKNFTQSSLADELKKILGDKYNIYTQTVSYWENGREPSFEILIALSEIFDVSVDYLIGKNNIKHSEYNETVVLKEEISKIEELKNDLKKNNENYKMVTIKQSNLISALKTLKDKFNIFNSENKNSILQKEYEDITSENKILQKEIEELENKSKELKKELYKLLSEEE